MSVEQVKYNSVPFDATIHDGHMVRPNQTIPLTGTYAMDRSDINDVASGHTTAPPVSLYESFLTCFGSLWGYVGIAACCACPPYINIEQGTVGIVKKFGRYEKLLEPGLNYFKPFVETVTTYDIRLVTLDLERQSVLTKDNISVNTDIVLNFRIVDVRTAAFGVADIHKSIKQCAYTTIRSIFGSMSLQDVLEKRAEISSNVRAIIEKDAMSWGVHVESINIKDIIIPDSMMQSLSAVPIARRGAEAKLINAQADVESAKLMRAASDILSTDGSMQIRYLEQISKLCQSPNSKIVFFPQQYRANGGGNNEDAQLVTAAAVNNFH